jgi:hypothetical protein
MRALQAGLHGVSAAAVSAGLGVFSAGNTPGHRRWIPLVVDSGSNVWTFGGEYPNTWNPTNDLWCFSFALKQWALQKGSAGGALSLVVGTRELPVSLLSACSAHLQNAHFSLFVCLFVAGGIEHASGTRLVSAHH